MLDMLAELAKYNGLSKSKIYTFGVTLWFVAGSPDCAHRAPGRSAPQQDPVACDACSQGVLGVHLRRAQGASDTHLRVGPGH